MSIKTMPDRVYISTQQSKPTRTIEVKIQECLPGQNSLDSSDAESFYSVATSNVKSRRNRQMVTRHERCQPSNPSQGDKAQIIMNTTDHQPRRRRMAGRPPSSWSTLYTSPTLTTSESTDSNIKQPFTTRRHSSSTTTTTKSRRMSGHLSIPTRHSSLSQTHSFGARVVGAAYDKRNDIVTLHRQSCQLFSSLDGMLALSRDITPLPSTTTSRSTTRHASMCSDTRPVITPVEYDEKIQIIEYTTCPISTSTSQVNLNDNSIQSTPDLSSRSTSNLSTPFLSPSRSSSQPTSSPSKGPLTSTISISWTSPSTRRREYTKIDAAHSGVRGFVRSVLLPKQVLGRRDWSCCRYGKRRGWRNFYGSQRGVDEEDSVRRFRVEGDEEDSEDEESGGEGGEVREKREDGGRSKKKGKAWGGGFGCF